MQTSQSSRGVAALRRLEPALEALPQDALLEPRLQLTAVLEDARDLAQTVSRPAVRERMRSVGVEDASLDELEVAIEALAESERRWAAARDARKTARQAHAEALGFPLRDEMVAACRHHLDGVEVLELLARVTDGESAADLVQDLRELAAFVRENTEAFRNDSTFDPVACADEATELGEAIALEAEPDAAALELLELRDRAFTYLCERVEQVRRAGRYAYRGTAEARAYFASCTVPARRRRPLPSSVRAIAE